jgi:hypothetical protein
MESAHLGYIFNYIFYFYYFVVVIYGWSHNCQTLSFCVKSMDSCEGARNICEIDFIL